MARVLAHPLAVGVKRANISHIADPVRQEGLSPDVREKLTAKYEETARLLGTTLEEILATHASPDALNHHSRSADEAASASSPAILS